MVDLSIIIPVFNAEKYLKRCLESVAAALGGISSEIIIVDNNSTDSSMDIVKRYNGHTTIKTVKCTKPGAAAARNAGVKIARGKYIWFVDADDAISKNSAQKLLSTAKKTNADLVMLGMKRQYADGHTDYLSAVRSDESNYKSRFVRYGMGPVQLLIRRTWWQENNFKFREGIIHEDMELMSALILYTDKYAAVDEPLYIYYQNEDSVLHKTTWDEHYFDIFEALECLHKRFKNAQQDIVFHDELEWFFIWNLLIDSARDFQKFPEGKSGLQKSRQLLKKYYPNWHKNRFLRQKPLKLRIKVLLNYFAR